MPADASSRPELHIHKKQSAVVRACVCPFRPSSLAFSLSRSLFSFLLHPSRSCHSVSWSTSSHHFSMANRGGRQPGDVEIGASNALQHHPQAHLAGPAHGAGHDHDHHQRRHPGDLEIGNTQVLLRHPTPHLAADHAPPVSERRLRWEAKRPLWLRECLAETTGVFCYTYSGVASTAALTLATAADEPAFGSLLTIGFACALTGSALVSAGSGR